MMPSHGHGLSPPSWDRGPTSERLTSYGGPFPRQAPPRTAPLPAPHRISMLSTFHPHSEPARDDLSDISDEDNPAATAPETPLASPLPGSRPGKRSFAELTADMSPATSRLQLSPAKRRTDTRGRVEGEHADGGPTGPLARGAPPGTAPKSKEVEPKPVEDSKEHWLREMNQTDVAISRLQQELGVSDDRRRIVLFEMEQEKQKKEDGRFTEAEDMASKAEKEENESTEDLIKRIYAENRQKVRLFWLLLTRNYAYDLIPSHTTHINSG